MDWAVYFLVLSSQYPPQRAAQPVCTACQRWSNAAKWACCCLLLSSLKSGPERQSTPPLKPRFKTSSLRWYRATPIKPAVVTGNETTNTNRELINLVCCCWGQWILPHRYKSVAQETRLSSIPLSSNPQMHHGREIFMSNLMLNVIQLTNRLQRLEIRFVIGESPVPGLTGKI